MAAAGGAAGGGAAAGGTAAEGWGALEAATAALLPGVARAIRRAGRGSLLQVEPPASGEEDSDEEGIGAEEDGRSGGAEGIGEGAEVRVTSKKPEKKKTAKADSEKKVRFAEDGEEDGDADWRAEELDHLRGAEDDFLKMAEMERFVRQAEDGSAVRALGGDDSDEEIGEDELGEDELDLLYGGGAEDDDSEGWESDDNDEEAVKMTYRDFFGARDRGSQSGSSDSEGHSDSEEGDSGEEAGAGLGVRGRASEARAGGGDSDSEEEDDGREPPDTVQGLRRQRMEDRIARLEERNMAEREWALRGEVKSGDRPFNSLLEAELDYERVLRPAPVTTEETTNALEAMIAARIQEGRFDDPVKISEDQLPKEGAHKTGEDEEAINDRRSKKGLGEEYADEFVKRKSGGAAGPAEQEIARAECWDLFRKINTELDALTNFDFTPAPVAELAAAALQKPGDAPALALEEVGAEAGTAASARAPEELLRSQAAGAPIAEGELDHSDRRTRRRKLKQKTRNSLQEKKNEALEGGRSKRKSVSTEVEAKMSQKRKRGGKKGAAAEPDRKATKFGRSTEVFSKLQEMRAGPAASGAATDAAPRRSATALKL